MRTGTRQKAPTATTRLYERDHPRDADERRVELAVEVRQREHDDRRVREGHCDTHGEGDREDARAVDPAHLGVGRSISRSRRRAEAEALVQRLRVPRVQQPAQLGKLASFDCLTYELDTQPSAAVLRQHVDVSEVRERVAVRDHSREADLRALEVQADNARRRSYELLHDLASPASCPVRLLGEVAVDGVHVDAR